jgi:hypothetical protein
MKLTVKESNLKYFYYLLFIFTIYFGLYIVKSDFKQFFISNDSIQYLDLAKQIYNNKKITEITRYAINLYYDELSLFKYDFNNLKPYHFPSYSIFLSLFYYIYNNDNFVVYFSQFLSFIIFGFSTFLILQKYLHKKRAFSLTLMVIFCSSIANYVSDCGKEIMLSGLGNLVIYLSLYSNRKFNNLNLLLISIILIFLCVSRSFYLFLAFLICIYHLIPIKYKYLDQNSLKNKDKIKIFLLIFAFPTLSYLYCYQYLEVHYFLYDNKSSIYGGKTINDLIMRIINNSYLSILVFFVNYFDPINSVYLFHLYQFFGFTAIGLFIYIKKIYSKLKGEMFLISYLDIINIFYGAIIISVIIRFTILGYRLTIGYLPIFFLMIYLYYNKKNNPYRKAFFFIFIFINLLFNLLIFSFNKKINKQYIDKNNFILEKINIYNPKKIAINNLFFPIHAIPLLNIFDKDIKFYIDWSADFCENLSYYHEHKIDFDLIFSSKKFEDSCYYINKNYLMVLDDKNNILYHLKSKNNN